MSHQIALQHPDWRESELFYKNVMDLDTKNEENHLHIQSGDMNLYIMENGNLRGTVIEFSVYDVETARKYLVNNGCTVVKWEGKGNDCYMRDPYDLVFNLWENKKE